MAITAEYAVANPQGGRVVAGDVTIAGSGNRLDVRQASDKGIVDWRSFNIGRAERTDFQQPSKSAVTLNRVRGGELSQIDGQLTANGRVFLVNPNGVVFGNESKVSVGGLVASTADVRDEDFMAGRYAFETPSGNPDAKVVNRGQITVDEGGAVVLAAPTVSNEGTIQARLGRVELAGANTFTVDFDGDGLFSFEVGEEVTETPSNSDDTALVSNRGTIIADGGVVNMTAAVADAVVDRVMNMDGVIQARSAEVKDGAIVLSGGEHGIVNVSGTLDASGMEPGQRGGQVKVLGEKVGLFAGAEVDASGDAGGGEVLIGGNFQGKGPEPNAKRTFVSKDSSINADAATEGDGGRVIVWADETTQFHGDISARGGKDGGDGGFVEVSGKQDLDFRGTVAVDAEYGMDGTVLLDPSDIVIREAPNPDENFGDPQISDGVIAFSEPGAAFTFSDEDLEGFLISDEALEGFSGNIILQAFDSITIQSAGTPINLVNQTEGRSIVFQANNDINVNRSITTHGGDIHFEADLGENSTVIKTLEFLPNVNVSTEGGKVTLIADKINLSDGNVFFNQKAALIDAGRGDINIARIIDEDPIPDDGMVELVGGEIRINSDPTNVFLAANDLKQIRTEGTLTLGRAQRKGVGGTGSIDVRAPEVIIESKTSFNARTVILEAETDIALNAPISAIRDDLTIEEPRALILQPAVPDTAIAIGGSVPDGFDISTSDLNNIPDEAFDSLTIGRDVDGAHTITITDATFHDPVTIQAPAAPLFRNTISVVSTGDGPGLIGEGDASITIKGDSNPLPIDLGGDGIDFDAFATSAQLGSIRAAAGLEIESAFVFLSGDYSTGEGAFRISGSTFLSDNVSVTTSDGAIEFSGAVSDAVNSSSSLNLDAGNAAISLTNPENNFTGALSLNNSGNSGVSVTNSGELVLGESNVGSGALTLTGTGITQTAGITQGIDGGAVTVNAGAGPITLTDEDNDFTGAVSLINTGANDVAIADSNTLELGSSTLGSGQVSVMAGDLDISGSVEGTGNISLQPLALNQSIGVGDGAGDFALSRADLANLRNDFSSITIGRSGLTGQVTIDNATFNDPLIIQADGSGGNIQVNNVLIGADNASITFNGSGQTTVLNGNILTNGNAIVFNDAVQLFSLADVTLNTAVGGGVGGDITFNGLLNGPANSRLTVRGGFWRNFTTAPLDLSRLTVEPTGGAGNGAAVFGRVANFGGRSAAPNVQVQGGVVDRDFTINGCVMGIPCEGNERPTFPDTPRVGEIPLLTVVEPINVWERRRRLQDPRDVRYSNLGNEELWWETKNEPEKAVQ